nr:glyoxylate/hydroxypyruvate reductase HPR3-like [Ipomoea batatas]GMD36470.1 glyoxylate/hydroxypyruvate reductase HPR3-like [Ipomoea batatas]
MAQENTRTNSPQIIVLGPPSVFWEYSHKFAEKFRLLKPWESALPLEEFLSAHAQTVEAMLCAASVSLSASLLTHLPSLRLVVTSSAGVNNIDLLECRRLGIAVANAPDIFSADVADLAVGLLIDVLRRISASDRFVKSRAWPIKPHYPLASKVGGKRVGIVGLGSIGQQVAKRLEAFGCPISYYSRKEKPWTSYCFYADVHQLATASDILVICCALTPETHHLINKEILLALGKEGVIVNIARGGVIDEKELVQCLLQGEIAGAGLDVYEHEPHVPKELLGLDCVVLSPHYAVFTHESFKQVYELIVGNLEAFFANQPLLSPLLHE